MLELSNIRVASSSNELLAIFLCKREEKKMVELEKLIERDLKIYKERSEKLKDALINRPEDFKSWEYDIYKKEYYENTAIIEELERLLEWKNTFSVSAK